MRPAEPAAATVDDPDEASGGRGVDITVAVIAYNHEAYVAQALDSVFAQQTRRSVEVIVSEDCSTDATRDIIASYADQRPGVRLICSDRNLHSNAVVGRAIRAARGRYFCMLDADDYWIDPNRLERQAALLDQRPELSGVFHNAMTAEGDSVTGRRWTPPGQLALLEFHDLCHGNPFATSAGMLRRSALDDLGSWYDHFVPMITDWPLYLHCSQSGPIAYVDEPVSVYRLHAGGIFSSQSGKAKLDQIEGLYRGMERVLPAVRRPPIRKGRIRFFFDRAAAHADAGEFELARDCLRRSLAAGGLGSEIGLRELQWLVRKIWLTPWRARPR